jgi:hypothetical protein
MSNKLKIKNIKTVYINEDALGKTKITEVAKRALKQLCDTTNVTIFASDKKKMMERLKETFGTIKEERLFKNVEKDNEGKVTRRYQEMEEIEVMAVKPRIIQVGEKESTRIALYEKNKGSSPYDMWIIESSKEVIAKFLKNRSYDRILRFDFETNAGAKGQCFLIEKHTDWNNIIDLDEKDMVPAKIIKDGEPARDSD